MPIAFVQSRSIDAGSSTSVSLAFLANNAAGNLIIVTFRVGAVGRTITASDSNGNTYNLAKSQVQTVDGHESFIYYALNIAAGANTLTFSISGAAAFLRMAIHEYSGIAASAALDQTNSAQGNSAAPDSGSVTTTQADELLFGMGSSGDAVAWTAGTNYTLRETPANKVGTEDRIVSATLPTSAGFSLSATSQWACLIATFKAAGGSTPVSRAIQAATEALASVSKSFTIPAESLAAIARAIQTPFESLAAVARSIQSPTESLKLLQIGAGSNTESLASPSKTVQSPAESLQQISQTKQSEIEALKTVSPGITTPIESLGDTPVSRAIGTSYESSASLSAQKATVLEYLAIVSRASGASVESLLGISQGGASGVESLTTVAPQRQTDIESGKALSVSIAVPVEILREISRQLATPLEALQGAQINLIINEVEITAYFAVEKNIEAAFAVEKNIEAAFAVEKNIEALF